MDIGKMGTRGGGLKKIIRRLKPASGARGEVGDAKGMRSP